MTGGFITRRKNNVTHQFLAGQRSAFLFHRRPARNRIHFMNYAASGWFKISLKKTPGTPDDHPVPAK
jgi:hypothetical protein